MAALALLASGCRGSGGEQARPPITEPAGSGGKVEPAGSGGKVEPGAPVRTEPAAGGERRPERVSFLSRAETCERFGEAVRPVALEAVGPYGFASSGSFETMATLDAAGPRSRESGTAVAGPAPAAAPSPSSSPSPKAGVDFSGTNVQEAGVDEPDAVKTDGKLLITATDSRLRVLDLTGPSGPPRQVGALDLPPGPGNLLLVGQRVLALSETWDSPVPVPGNQRAPRPSRATTRVTVVDLADPAKPSVLRTHTIDGSYVDARLIGGVARVITRSAPDISFPQPAPDDQGSALPPEPAGSPEQSRRANAEIVRRAAPAAFLPDGASCADAYVPVEASGIGTTAVQSIDPAADAPGPAVTVVADASTVYASATRLFVATNRSAGGGVRPATGAEAGPTEPAGSGGKAEPAGSGGKAEPARTAIHAFDITDPAKARYAGSGDVPGRLLNQFSLSEDAGVLRVASTIEPLSSRGGAERSTDGQSGAGVSQSRVTILRPAGEEWVETGAVDGLGKGERIYAVRFLGTTGYVVTFRQVDPLYVLDLRDVRAPKVTGELKITGYSAYLHPAGDRRLLGIGQEATEQGRRVGTQLSLFDVGNPAAPTKLAGAVLPSASSSAEQDHHAFLFWPATGLVVAPVTSFGPVDQPTVGGSGARPFVGAVAFRVGEKSVTEAGRISHPGSTRIDRSLVVGDRLLTVSQVGLATNDLSTLADGGFVAFR